jgi:hypothetical protein
MEILSLYVVVILFFSGGCLRDMGRGLRRLLSISCVVSVEVDHVVSIELMLVLAAGGGAGAPASEMRSWRGSLARELGRGT